MKKVKSTDGTNISYLDWGVGHPVLFVHGFAMSAASFETIMYQVAAQGFRCIAIDKRGHGNSDRPFEGYDYDQLADDIDALIKALNLDNVVLVGHSMGCAEIVRYVTRHGESQCAGLVLASGALPVILKSESNPEGVEAAVFESYQQMILADAPSAYRNAMAPVFFGGQVSDDVVDWGIRIAEGTSIAAAIRCTETYSTADFRDELPEISLPTLVLHGEADGSMPPSLTAERTVELIPNARIKIYKDGPHAIYLTHTSQFVADILSFCGV